MQILIRINRITWQFRTRLILAYLTCFAAIGFSFLIPILFGRAIDSLVVYDAAAEKILPQAVDTDTLVIFAVILLGASLARGIFDFARTYTTDSLSQFVTYDLRNRFYDKLQNLSFAYHDREHTGDLMSKATADVEAIRRYVNMGMVRSLEVVVRLVGLVAILSFINWELTLISLAFVPFVLVRSTQVMGQLRRMWLQVQEKMGETVTILQEKPGGHSCGQGLRLRGLRETEI